MAVVFKLRCVGCGAVETRTDVLDMPMCERCFSPMVAVSASPAPISIRRKRTGAALSEETGR